MEISGSLFLANLAKATAGTPDLIGGAIYILGDLNITDSTFASNSAQYGGALYNHGTLNASNVRFSANLAANDGGAIYHDLGSTTVTRATFRQNSAEEYGGAVSVYDGSVDISAATFLENTATIGGSVINLWQPDTALSLSWSTINQPKLTSASIYIGIDPITPAPRLKGVILTGATSHCNGFVAQLVDAYTLSNGTNCSLVDPRHIRVSATWG